jgi:hypothetical protein
LTIRPILKLKRSEAGLSLKNGVGRLRQEDLEFQASLDYIASLSQINETKTKTHLEWPGSLKQLCIFPWCPHRQDEHVGLEMLFLSQDMGIPKSQIPFSLDGGSGGAGVGPSAFCIRSTCSANKAVSSILRPSPRNVKGYRLSLLACLGWLGCSPVVECLPSVQEPWVSSPVLKHLSSCPFFHYMEVLVLSGIKRQVHVRVQDVGG